MDWKARAERFKVRFEEGVPPGLRNPLGLLLILGGVPEFWMIPLGAVRQGQGPQ